ncbi:MAG: 16S rRNA (adenine(1518)-N(6)/adenine(1519)-N(6))-dimethyltransferase RsmA [Verrucomicrobiota bacterium]|nr:16S rRNA (adenine(1518)-N(6)/adenine(1519)-N(6))-dimethyltransferase RsmA [Verrucomicrobiota bacterium]
MNRNDIRTTLDEESVRLSKSLGQNLLHDQNVLRRIAKAADLQEEDQVLEIGPGLGALTEHLLEAVNELTAIEKDQRLHKHLNKRFTDQAKLRLIHHDALKYFENLEIDWTNWKLVSNLPYSVASPLLVDLAAMPQGPQRLVVTVQWEVGQRLNAQPSTRDYSKLTLLVGCRYQVREIFKISPHCFFPEPRVDSACITLDRRTKPLFADELHKPFTSVVKRAFSQRRKMMRKNLKGGWPEEKLDAAMAAVSLDSKIRAEKVSMDQFVMLTKELHDG